MKEENVSAPIRHIVEQLVARLTTTYGEGLISVILYGSAASGEFSAQHSNINLVIVLDDARLEKVKKMQGYLQRYRFRRVAPLFFTEDYIARSLDVFPIEFLDMQENYVVFYGKDLFRELRVDTRNLRFQCEQELKSKLITIKSAYVKIRTRDELNALLMRSFASVMHLSRNLLRLKGQVPAYVKEELILQLVAQFNCKAAIFKRIAEAKRKDSMLSEKETDSLIMELASELERIIEIVDQS